MAIYDDESTSLSFVSMVIDDNTNTIGQQQKDNARSGNIIVDLLLDLLKDVS